MMEAILRLGAMADRSAVVGKNKTARANGVSLPCDIVTLLLRLVLGSRVYI